MSGAGAVEGRLAVNRYEVDDEASHIDVDQEVVRATGTAGLLERVCPAGVYAAQADGSVTVDEAACLECGACLAVAAPGSLAWRYPRGGYGVRHREG